MGVFSATVPREMYEDMKRARDTWQQECALLRTELTQAYKELVAVKRHELGLPPAGFEPKDPASVLGPRTKAAIQQQSGDFTDLAGYLTNWAIGQMTDRLARNQDTETADAEVAHAIRMGETE